MKKTVDQSELEIPQFVKERLIVDETRKMIYCPIPKAGSSNWKRIFIKLTHPEYEDTEDLLDIRGVHHIELPTLDSFSEEKQEKVLKEYRKFIIIKILICTQVRMAERSKAPDSSIACADPAYECSGLQLEAWVRIPLLTKFCFHFGAHLITGR